MVCTTVTVTAPPPPPPTIPTVTVTDYAFSYGTGCIYGNMNTCAAKLNESVAVRATFYASARAKVKINIEYDKDGVTFYEGWYVANQILEAGSTTLCLVGSGYTYKVGTYSGLKVTVSEVAAA